MKKLREMRNPLKYVQGRDALLSFCKETEYMGKNYLFVCSHSAYEACHDKLEQSFEGTDRVRHYEIFGGISSESEIARMRKIVEEQGIDTVVGVGGGSAVDTAKATAFYEKKHIVIIPTVVATDAPCTGLSVIYHDDGSFKEYLFYPTNPDCVLVWEMRWEPISKEELLFVPSLPVWKMQEFPEQEWCLPSTATRI